MALAASTAGALKALIESLGLSLAAYADRAPSGTKPPYVVIQAAIALVPGKLEDGGAGQVGTETVQVDLWQLWKTPANKMGEDPALKPALVRGLHGAALPLSPTRSYMVLVRSAPRLVEWDANLIHDPITVEIPRVL